MHTMQIGRAKSTLATGKVSLSRPAPRVSCDNRLIQEQIHQRIVVKSKALGQIAPYTLMICHTLRFIHHNMLLPSPKFSLDQYHPTKTLLQDSHLAR